MRDPVEVTAPTDVEMAAAATAEATDAPRSQRQDPSRRVLARIAGLPPDQAKSHSGGENAAIWKAQVL